MTLSRAALRRLLAATLLFGFAIGSAYFWSDGEIKPVTLIANLGSAAAGFAFLHFRWRAKEARAMTPDKVKDIFS